MRQVRVNFRLFLTLVAQPLRLQPDTLALNVQFFPFREQTPFLRRPLSAQVGLQPRGCGDQNRGAQMDPSVLLHCA